ncbi:hypothetical protein PI125_g17162 [Phytophthora idaei]|nr:hypothetical protein PI125_g17162 [Phytophthora idaei]KAG3148187.1 hypothetical protein PI126_g12557 [Phytophthora idaei]
METLSRAWQPSRRAGVIPGGCARRPAKKKKSDATASAATPQTERWCVRLVDESAFNSAKDSKSTSCGPAIQSDIGIEIVFDSREGKEPSRSCGMKHSEGVFRVGVKWHDSTHNHLIDKNVFNTYAETRKSASLRLVALVGQYGKV